MIDKVFIFEVHYSNFNRYVHPLADYLIEKDVAKEVYLIYDGFTKSELIKAPNSPRVHKRPAKEAYRAYAGERGGETAVFFNYSYRIPDLYWTYRFKKAGAYTYQMQHGMYAEFLERSFLGYFSAFGRKMTFLKYLLFFLAKGERTIFKYMVNKDFIKSFKTNAQLKQQSHKIAPVRSDHLLIWGDYWKTWFMDNHFYEATDTSTTVGNPDYHTFIKGKRTPMQKDKICYIAQTLVEDGRMDRADYKLIIDGLATAFGERLMIKLHPRSDKTIFEKVLACGGSLHMDFPICGTYLGHYSSLLALAANENSKVYLLEVNNEEIPSYFTAVADGVYSGLEEMITAVNSAASNPGAKDISFYFENKEDHPFDIISRDMGSRL